MKHLKLATIFCVLDTLRLRRLSLLVIGGLGVALNLQAQSTWQLGSGSWGVAGNWSPAGVPDGQDVSVIFDNNINNANRTITVNGAFTVGNLLINGVTGTTTTTFGSGTLTFDSTAPGGAVFRVQGSNHATVNNTTTLRLNSELQLVVDLGAASSFANNFIINGAIQGNGYTINAVASNPAGTITLGGVVSGTGTRLLKSGGGILSFTGYNNTFDGGLDIYNGRVNTTVRTGAGGGIVIGALETNANNLGAGNILVANNGTILEVKSSGANQFVELRSGTLSIVADGVGSPRFQLTEAATNQNGFTFKMTGGVLDGGAKAGDLYLLSTDFNYSAGQVINAPNLVLDTTATVNASNNISITLNGAAMDGYLGAVTKLGNNNLTFTDSGTFRARELVITSGSGTVSLGQAVFDLTNGLTYTGTNSPFTNLLTVTNLTNLGIVNQLGASALNLGDSVISNIRLTGFDQTFANINLGNNARLGLWFDNTTPSTLTIGNLAASAAAVNPLGQNYLSIYNWTGNPDTHPSDGTLTTSNTVKYSGSVDLSKVWFRGYAPGAVLDASGNLVPVDFLTTTFTSTTAGSWFDLNKWSVDVPTFNSAGSVVTWNTPAAFAFDTSLGNQAVTIGSLVVIVSVSAGNAEDRITGGTLIFDSGMLLSSGTKASSFISGSGAIAISATIVLANDLTISTTGYSGRGASGSYSTKLYNLSGTGNIILNGTNSMHYYFAGDNNNYFGNVDVYTGILDVANNNSFNGANRAEYNVITMHGGGISNAYSTTNVPVLKNKLVIDGNFSASNLQFDYAGDVSLRINPAIATSGMVAFGTGLNLVDEGSNHNSLTINTAANSRTYFQGDSNTFSGGFIKMGSGTAIADLHNDLVVGISVVWSPLLPEEI